jgi:hypothetical protein
VFYDGKSNFVRIIPIAQDRVFGKVGSGLVPFCGARFSSSGSGRADICFAVKADFFYKGFAAALRVLGDEPAFSFFVSSRFHVPEKSFVTWRIAIIVILSITIIN